MARKLASFIVVVALAVLVSACEGNRLIAPSSTPLFQPSITTVKMISISPQDGASLAYGDESQVEVYYTVADEFSADLLYGGVIVLSCLSVDGQNIIRDSCAGRLVHDQSGVVTNNPGLGNHHRGKIVQTRYVINQVRRFGDDSVVIAVSTPRIWNFE